MVVWKLAVFCFFVVVVCLLFWVRNQPTPVKIRRPLDIEVTDWYVWNRLPHSVYLVSDKTSYILQSDEMSLTTPESKGKIYIVLADGKGRIGTVRL